MSNIHQRVSTKYFSSSWQWTQQSASYSPHKTRAEHAHSKYICADILGMFVCSWSQICLWKWISALFVYVVSAMCAFWLLAVWHVFPCQIKPSEVWTPSPAVKEIVVSAGPVHVWTQLSHEGGRIWLFHHLEERGKGTAFVFSVVWLLKDMV